MTKIYQSYMFRDKDPIIHRLYSLIADQKVSFTYVETKSGVTARTLHAWFQGKTKRPQHCTIAAVAACLGYEVTFTARSAPNVVPIHRKASK